MDTAICYQAPEPLDPLVETIIDGIFEREGDRFTDHPADRGGPTKFGITIETLSHWRVERGLPPATVQDVRDLSAAEARRIYRQDYAIGPGFMAIADEQLRFHVIDAGVNHGPAWAARRLQEVAEVTVDGMVGPITLAAVNGADPDRLHLRFIARRMKKYTGIVTADARARGLFEGQIEFLDGWANRLAWFIDDEADSQRKDAA